MTLKSDARFEGKLNCNLKNYIRNLANFHASRQKSENLHFDWIVLSRAHKDLDEKLTLGSKKDIKNLLNFYPTKQKSKNFTSMGYFCQGYMSFELKNFRGVTFHETEQSWKICINPDHVVWKMTWGIG